MEVRYRQNEKENMRPNSDGEAVKRKASNNPVVEISARQLISLDSEILSIQHYLSAQLIN